MTNYWPVIVILAVGFLVTIFISLRKNKDSDFNSNYQNKEFEHFLNVLKDATDTHQQTQQIKDDQQTDDQEEQSEPDDKEEE